MNCDKYYDNLSLYVLNELSKQEADDITLHLKECPECIDKVNELKALLQNISKINEIEPPNDFLEKLTAKAEDELWDKKKKYFDYRRIIKYASIAAVFVVSIYSASNLLNLKMHSKADESSSSTISSSNGSQHSMQNDKANINNKESYDVNIQQNQSSNSVEIKSDGNKDQNYVVIEPGATKDEANKESYGSVIETQNKNTQEQTAQTEVSIGQSSTATQDTQDIKNIDDKKSTKVTIATDKDISAAPKAVNTPSPNTNNELAKTAQFALQKMEITTSSIDDAINNIENQAKKVGAAVIPTISSTPNPSAVKGLMLDIKEKETFITIEVKKENVDQFTKALKEVFGDNNLSYTINETENVTPYIRYEIKIIEKSAK